MWRLGAGSALLVIGQGAMLGFIVLFLHDERGVDAGLAAAALAAVQLGGAAARLLAGRRSDTEGARRFAEEIQVSVEETPSGVSVVTRYPEKKWSFVGRGFVSYSVDYDIAMPEGAQLEARNKNTIVSVGGALAPAAFGWLVHATTWSVGYGACAVAPVAAFVVLRPLVGEERRRIAIRERRLQGFLTEQQPQPVEAT